MPSAEVPDDGAERATVPEPPGALTAAPEPAVGEVDASVRLVVGSTSLGAIGELEADGAGCGSTSGSGAALGSRRWGSRGESVRGRTSWCGGVSGKACRRGGGDAARRADGTARSSSSASMTGTAVLTLIHD